MLFHSGQTLPPSKFFDTSQGIRIEVGFADIEDSDLERLAKEFLLRKGPRRFFGKTWVAEKGRILIL